jgi:hypothetical protein
MRRCWASWTTSTRPWAFGGAQADFRIPERLPPNGVTFAAFSDEELEAIYTDQVATFVKYQTDVALRRDRCQS